MKVLPPLQPWRLVRPLLLPPLMLTLSPGVVLLLWTDLLRLLLKLLLRLLLGLLGVQPWAPVRPVCQLGVGGKVRCWEGGET